MRFLSYAAALLLASGVLQAQSQEKPQPPASQKAVEGKKTGGPEEKSPRKRVVTNLAGFDLLDPGKVGKQPMVVGATRGLARPVALAPRLGKLYGANPAFAWRCDNESSTAIFLLTDDAQTEVFRVESGAAGYRYPPEAPPLQPGATYFWTVEVQSPLLGASTSAPVGLLVVSSSQREAIEKKLAQFPGDTYDAGLARARVFTDSRLWYDALAAYTELIKRYPDRGELYEQRGMIYAQLDATKSLAEEDFARAEKVQHGTRPPGR
jgi:hypothetical protein